jgi:hypothetical protein
METNPQEPEKKKRGKPKPRSAELAMSIAQFCSRHAISEQFFHLLQQRGQGPRTMRLGSRVLITVEEAQRWRKARTAKKSAA